MSRSAWSAWIESVLLQGIDIAPDVALRMERVDRKLDHFSDIYPRDVALRMERVDRKPAGVLVRCSSVLSRSAWSAWIESHCR